MFDSITLQFAATHLRNLAPEGEGGKVKNLVVLTLVLLASPAYAQNMGGKGGEGRNSPQNADQQKAEQQKKNAAEDAYQAG